MFIYIYIYQKYIYIYIFNWGVPPYNLTVGQWFVGSMSDFQNKRSRRQMTSMTKINSSFECQHVFLSDNSPKINGSSSSCNPSHTTMQNWRASLIFQSHFFTKQWLRTERLGSITSPRSLESWDAILWLRWLPASFGRERGVAVEASLMPNIQANFVGLIGL